MVRTSGPALHSLQLSSVANCDRRDHKMLLQCCKRNTTASPVVQDAMSEAVELADLMLYGVSEKYKER